MSQFPLVPPSIRKEKKRKIKGKTIFKTKRKEKEKKRNIK